jgi:hypothetical protein
VSEQEEGRAASCGAERYTYSTVVYRCGCGAERYICECMLWAVQEDLCMRTGATKQLHHYCVCCASSAYQGAQDDDVVLQTHQDAHSVALCLCLVIPVRNACSLLQALLESAESTLLQKAA